MKLLVALLACGVAFTGCNQSDGGGSKSKAVNETSTGNYMDAMEFLRAKKEYTKLVEIIEANGLQDEFMKEEESTVFAPTNKGFETLTDESFDQLLKNKEIAERIIRHHIVSGKLSNADLKAKDEVVTKMGETVAVKKTNFGGLAEADVVSPNNGYRYGYVHGINRVLMPLGETKGETKGDEKSPDEKVPQEQQQEQGKVPDEQQQEQQQEQGKETKGDEKFPDEKVPQEQQQEQGKVPDEQQQEQQQEQGKETKGDEKFPDEKVPQEQQQEQGKVPDEQQQEQQQEQGKETKGDEKFPDEKVPQEQQQEQGKIPDEQQQEQQEQGQEQQQG